MTFSRPANFTTMTKPNFETHWLINGEQHFNIDEVSELVDAGHIAVEVPAVKQAEAWELAKAQERWHAAAIERHAKFTAEAAHRASPEGRAETARREAALHSGSRVTVAGPKNDEFAELDYFGVEQTNVFK